MAQSNISLSYPNRIDECTLTSTSSWSTLLPLANVKNRVLKKVARTNIGTKEFDITVNLPTQREIGCVALVKHNFSTSAKFRVIGYSGLNCTGTVRFDSTASFMAYPVINSPETGVVPWGDPTFWGGSVSESQRKSYTSLAIFYPPSNQMCLSVKIAVSDTGNTDNYLQVGRVFLGRTVMPENNPEFGDISQGYVDLTDVRRANDNTKYFNVKQKLRTLSCTLKHLNKEEAFSGFYDAQRECGISGEMIYAFSKPEYMSVAPNINMTVDKNFYARTFICNFSDLSPIDMPYVNGYSTVLKLEEIT